MIILKNKQTICYSCYLWYFGRNYGGRKSKYCNDVSACNFTMWRILEKRYLVTFVLFGALSIVIVGMFQMNMSFCAIS